MQIKNDKQSQGKSPPPQSQYQDLTDPIWRLNNLYTIKTKEGEIIPFKPRPEQQEIIEAIYKHGHRKIFVLKARQLGQSTVIELILVDYLMWNRGAQAAIVDCTQLDASKKLANKIKLAWDHLPQELRNAYETGVDSTKQFQLKIHGDKVWSEVQAGMNARGDTFQFLHVCLHPGTLVYTRNAKLIPVEQLTTKHKVLTKSGGYTSVKQVVASPPEFFPSVEVDVFGSPAPLRLTANHEVWVRSKHGSGEQGEWKRAGDLTPKDYVGFPVRNPSARPVMWKGERQLLPPVLGWLCGLFLAEGSLRTRQKTPELRFALHKKEVPDALQAIEELGGNGASTTPNQKSKCVVVYPNFKPLAEFLQQHFIDPETGDKWLPDKIWKWGAPFLHELVRGYFDGDGCYRNPHEIQVTSTRRQFLDQLRLLLISLRYGVPSIYYRPAGNHYGRNCKEVWVLKLMGPANWKFREIFGLPLPEVKTWTGQHRISKGQRPDGRKLWRRGKGCYWQRVRSVKPIPSPELVYDVVLDTEDHAFTTEQGVVHNSEWGTIQFEDEHRSTEILTGALPAAEEGITIVETTWKGGKGGPLYDHVLRPALETAPEHLTAKDFKVFFFPWWVDPNYQIHDGDPSQIPEELTNYFNEVEQLEDTVLTPAQRLWYFKVAYRKGFFRFREYPSTKEECFKGLIEGAIYQEAVMQARAQGRIRNFIIRKDVLTHTVWDIGAPHNTVVWFFQFNPAMNEITFVDVMLAEEDLATRVAKIYSKGYCIGRHYLPHDARHPDRRGQDFTSMLSELGLSNLTVLDKPMSIWPGINHALGIFNQFVFHASNTAKGVEGLEAYHTKKDKNLGYISSVPVHDWSSHIADPIRVLAEAEMSGMLSRDQEGLTVQRKKRRHRQRLARI